MLNMFRILIHPTTGACDFFIVSTRWSCVLVSMCVGVSVWLCWSFGVVVLEWYPCGSRNQEPATFLFYHHIGCVFLFRCVLVFWCGWLGCYACSRLAGGKKKLSDSSRLDVVEIARVPDVLPSLFPFWSG